MRLTGAQLEALGEFADGTDVLVTPRVTEGRGSIDVYRYEDQQRVAILVTGFVIPVNTFDNAKV